MSRSLKQQNAWLIRTALLVQAIAFAFFAFQPLLLAHLLDSGSIERLQAALIPGSMSLGVIALARLALLGIVPPNLRDRLVLWRWHYPLPGSRAFSKIGPADSRVDMRALKQEYGSLPSDPHKQGILFYSIYRKHSESVGVLDAHKSYLATRDIATINLLMLISLPFFAYWATGDLMQTFAYAALLFVAYVAFSVAAQVYAIRLVQNVLAVAAPSITS